MNGTEGTGEETTRMREGWDRGNTERKGKDEGKMGQREQRKKRTG